MKIFLKKHLTVITHLWMTTINLKKVFFISSLIYLPVNSWAQISTGLKESALGNSGVAFSDSSAPSFYNPALLSEKKKSFFSITGTTLNYFSSSDDESKFTSSKLAPNYTSSIHAFESFVHEFSLANRASIDSKILSTLTDGTKSTLMKMDLYVLSYSMAFRNFPFGFQVGLRMNENSSQINQQTSDGNISQGLSVEASSRSADAFFAFGGIHQLGNNYRFGYKYESRGLNVYNKLSDSGSFYYYDQANNLFHTGKTDVQTDKESTGQLISIGHSFVFNDHEFLTDSVFSEENSLNNTFSFNQSFGYKVNFTNKSQFMCGMSHRFSSDVADISESNYFSSGYSWVTNALRSTISIYYQKQNEPNSSESAGFTFGSEFSY